MSKSSIYETGWINLVFEGRNKEYGAYQLRKENSKNAISALFIGLLLLVSIVSIPAILNHLNPRVSTAVELPPDVKITPIVLNTILPNQVKQNKKTAIPIAKKPNTDVAVKKEQLVNIVLVSSNLANQNIAKNTENTSSSVISDGKITDGTPTTTPSENGAASTVIPATNEVVAPVALDKLPEFPGGINKFYNYVGNNFEKTEIGEEKTIRVYVSFVIERDGSMTDIQVKKDPGYGVGKEAIRVLKSLRTKWSPGMLDGKAVRTSYNLPITVEMN
jgi:hypothetical protein